MQRPAPALKLGTIYKIICYLFMLVIKSSINYYLIVALTRRLAKGNLLRKQEMKKADGLTVDFLNLVQEVDGLK